jgi:hypothetical protein
LRLLSNRTSATALILTFFHSVVTIWSLYFLPVYFQGVLRSSPEYSGVQLLPTILTLVPAAIMGGAFMSKTGRYRPVHHFGYALVTIGAGLFTLLDAQTSTGKWVGYQIVQSAGAGMMIPTLLPAVMAPLTEADTALATATWAFLRSFGLTWGTAIPAAIFNNRAAELAGTVTDPAVAATLAGGRAYEHAVASYVNALPDAARGEFIGALTESLKRIWQVSIAFAAFGFLLVIFEKELKLRDKLETEFGMDDGREKKAVPKEGKSALQV